MTINGMMWRFALAYFAGVLAVGSLLHRLGIDGGGWANLAVLAACVTWICRAYGKANGEYFDSSQEISVVFGLLGIDLVLQALLTGLSVNANLQAGPFVLILVAVGAMHLLGIYIFVKFTGRSLEA